MILVSENTRGETEKKVKKGGQNIYTQEGQKQAGRGGLENLAAEVVGKK